MNMQFKKKGHFFHKEESSGFKEVVEFFLIFLMVTGICGALFYHFWGHLDSIPETFTDIIIEHPATTGINKSGELHLFWCLLPLGILLLSLFLLLLRKVTFQWKRLEKYKEALGKFYKKYIPPYLLLLILPLIIRFVLYKATNIGLIFAVAILFLSYIFFQDIYKEILLTFILMYYSVISIFTVVSHFTEKANIDTHTIYIITFVMSFLFLGFCLLLKKKEWIKTGIYLLQFLLPFLLLVFLVDTYLYQGTLIRIPYGTFYYIFFAVLWFACQGAVFFLWKKKDMLISIASPVLIFIYNSFSAAPMYAQPDQHHHGEQMIPWQQVFELGQKLYTEYTPVSGLFPMVSGTIQNVFLKGTVSDYSPAISITMVIFSAITMFLLAKHVGNTWALVFAVCFALPCYNRQYMVLPVLLLLTLPSLVKNKGLWLCCYVFSCFLAGLYYPLFGAALLLGIAPFGLWQLITYIQSGALKSDIKKPGFYISWLICLIPIIFSLPLLFKLLNHTLTYSSQTVLADGISLFGQTAPSNLFPYLSEGNFKNMCYIFMRFFLPLIGVWLLLYVLLKYVLITKHTFSKLKDISNPSFLFGLLSGAIVLMFSYSYTLVRADYNMILSRTAPILIAVAGMFLPVLLLAYGTKLSKSFITVIVALSFCLPIILYTKVEDMKFPNMWVYPNGSSDILLDDGDKLFTYYTVPEGFFLGKDLDISKETAANLGAGFMIGDQIHYINDYEKVINKCNAVKDNTTYLGFDGQGFYYFNNVKACATGYIPAAKGYEAQKEIIETAEKNPPVIFLLNSESNYYIYYWMWEKGYQYKAKDNAFYPSDLYALIYKEEPADNYLDYFTGEEYGHDFGLIAGSFGNSMETLEPLFTDEMDILEDFTVDASLTSYTYQGNFSGTDYDFLYLELSSATPDEAINSFSSGTVTVAFEADGVSQETASRRLQWVTCTIKDGKLLIPVGMNPNWLLNNISSIRITAAVSLEDKALPLNFNITSAKLLKIRQ